jgi:hypothetical protein
MHQFAAGGTTGSFCGFQPAFAGNKLAIAYLANVSLFAGFRLAKLINRLRIASRALDVANHDLGSPMAGLLKSDAKR